jgi:hypothetical protein
MSESIRPTAIATRAKQIFKDSPEELKELIRSLLASEREVMHMKVKKDIHKNFYDHIRRIIK